MIMNVTAAIAMRMPVTIGAVSASPKTTVPTRIAVMGSNTPRTEAFVAPMLRVAMASEAVETTVGNKASPRRFIHAPNPSMPCVMGVVEVQIFAKKTTAPTESV